MYKLKSGVWTRLPDLKYGRHAHSCAVMGGNSLSLEGHGVYADTSVEVMSISSETWSVGPSLPADYYWGEADQQPLLSIILSSICFTHMGM